MDCTLGYGLYDCTTDYGLYTRTPKHHQIFRQRNKYFTQFRLTSSKPSFVNNAIRAWNTISEALQNTISVDRFKRNPEQRFEAKSIVSLFMSRQSNTNY